MQMLTIVCFSFGLVPPAIKTTIASWPVLKQMEVAAASSSLIQLQIMLLIALRSWIQMETVMAMLTTAGRRQQLRAVLPLQHQRLLHHRQTQQEVLARGKVIAREHPAALTTIVPILIAARMAFAHSDIRFN